MKILLETGPNEVKTMNTAQLRAQFLLPDLVQKDALALAYTMYDRMVLGCAFPVNNSVQLENYDALKSQYFLERREIGIINIGGSGSVHADGQVFSLEKLSCLYLGRGTQSVSFVSAHADDPALFYLLSTPAHQTFPNTLFHKNDAAPVELGEAEKVNKRTIYKYIHKDGIQSCQLVMGLTVLQPGNIWNTMPAHTHLRRSEAYFYFDMAPDTNIIHLMGAPQETRHLVVRNHQAIISPPWSIHSGAGTAAYSFIWAMGGENQDFTDMDFVGMDQLA
ncbi:MAG: 5-dehydro-4-deoxy-D-glucuronate isomerase [Saprospiraceae bacterium]